LPFDYGAQFILSERSDSKGATSLKTALRAAPH